MPVGTVIPGLQRTQWGPFAGGAIDLKNPLLHETGSLVDAQNCVVIGADSLLCRKGSSVAMTFQDDQGTPANVTSIRYVGPFTDRALVIAHSTATSKTYGYIVASDFTGWYNASDTLTVGTTAAPTFILWTSETAAPDVTVAEGLGIAFIANTAAADANGLNWASYRVMLKSGTWDASTLHSDLDANGTIETLFFAGCLSFQQHCWAWGFGAGTTAATGFNPSMARFSTAIFAQNTDDRDYFDSQDSITLGDRVDSLRERIIAGGVAGQSLFLFSTTQAARVTGYGRDTWQRDPVDKTYGIIGSKAICTAGDYVYYWSNRGPMRLNGNGASAPEPLWDGIPEAVIAATNGGNPAGIVLGFDRANDQVQCYYQSHATEGLVRFASWDHRREIWLGPDALIGIGVACAGAVEPVYSVTSPPGPPSGPPTLVTSAGQGPTQFFVNWTAGDSAAQTVVQYRVNGTTDWITATTADPGVLQFTVTGATTDTAYDVQVFHVKNGQDSSVSSETPYATTTEFVAINPTDTTMVSFGPVGSQTAPTGQLTWTNQQTGAKTEIWFGGPSTFPPASLSLAATVDPGVASYTIGPVSQRGTYWMQTRAVLAGYIPSAFDPAGTPVSATLFAGGGPL